tara:strand:- start:538 stop:714 length:177 start_codon:yes stop_codon:yes gene_type:complete
MEEIPHYKIDENLFYPQENKNLCREITCVIGVFTFGCTCLSLLIISAVEGELNYNITI